MKIKPLLVVLTMVISSFISLVKAQAPEIIGGPYIKDSHTVALLHFEGDYTNDTDLSDNAEGKGQSQFFPISAVSGLGQCLYLKNDSPLDSSYVIIPDDPDLDLSGDWTIEAWFNVQTYGTGQEDHRFWPVVMWKPGVPTFDQGNYFMEVKGDVQWISTGYAVSGNGWPSVQSTQNSIKASKWYHVTLIRDTRYQVLVQMVHDENMNLISSGFTEYNPETQSQPILTERPVYLGFNGGSTAQSSAFDGFMDEIRISNIVRNFAIPPVVTNITTIPNQSSSASSYPPLTAMIPKIGSSEITSVKINYNGGNGWKTTDMTISVGDSLYSGTIPVMSSGAIIYYYISAENAAGQRTLYPKNAEETELPSYLSFAVEEPNTQTMDLTFEEGALPVQDHSIYNHSIASSGFPLFDTNAKNGSKSLAFHAATQDYLEINTPVIGTSDEITIDYWMNPTTMDGYWAYIINKPALGVGAWGENSFEIFYGANDDPTHKLTAGKFTDGEQTRITLPVSLELGKWYRVLYEIRKAPEGDAFNYYLLFQVNDENNNKLASSYAGFMQAPNHTEHPMRIGEASGRGVYYDGLIDDFKCYNFATNIISVDAAPAISVPDAISNQPATAENYTVNAQIDKTIGSDITDARLYYKTTGDWASVSMTGIGNEYSTTIQKQQLHSIIYYYISATNADNHTTIFPANALSEENPDYLSFAVEEEKSQVLALTFENSSADPKDESAYGSFTKKYGSPLFSDDAKEGSHSLQFDGTSSLKVYSPLMGSSEEFAVDFWVNAANMSKYWSFIANKPAISVPSWGENTFEFLYGAFDDAAWKFTAGIYNREEGNIRITLPTLVEFNKWYHLLLEVTKAPVDSGKNYMVTFELRDENDSFIERSYKFFNSPITQSFAPLLVGKAGNPTDWPEYFNGKIDNFRVFNYPALKLITEVEDKGQNNILPATFELEQNYPNPFNPSTEIRFSVPSTSRINLSIYNILGQKVRTLLNDERNAGTYSVTWNGRDDFGITCSSGIYYYRVQAEEFSQVKKMVLLK